MAIETELRFLVKGDKWKNLSKGVEIWQGFISSHFQRVVRVRIYGEDAYITIKGEKNGDDNPEFEWPILKEQAIEMFNTPHLIEGYSIHKYRYKIPFTHDDLDANLFWEVDEFLDENEPLKIAEIELKGIANKEKKMVLKKRIFDNLPLWIGKRIDHASNDKDVRYFNNQLSQLPFSLWKEEDKSDMMNHL